MSASTRSSISSESVIGAKARFDYALTEDSAPDSPIPHEPKKRLRAEWANVKTRPNPKVEQFGQCVHVCEAKESWVQALGPLTFPGSPCS